MHLELNADEARVLQEVLQRSTRDLEVEILHTDNHDFRDFLKERKRVVDGLLGRVGKMPRS